MTQFQTGEGSLFQVKPDTEDPAYCCVRFDMRVTIEEGVAFLRVLRRPKEEIAAVRNGQTVPFTH